MATFWKRMFGAEPPEPPLAGWAEAKAELLPCPFCGNAEVAYQLVAHRPRKRIIACYGCDVEMNVTFDSSKIAVQKWNSRVEAWREPLRS